MRTQTVLITLMLFIAAPAPPATGSVMAGSRSTIHALEAIGANDRSAAPSGYRQVAECADPHEPNDSFATAWTLASNTIQSYVCCDPEFQDLDSYKFAAKKGDMVRLEITDLPADYELCLYDPLQQPILCSNNGGTVSEFIEKSAELDGDYYAQVKGVGGACSSEYSYTLALYAGAPPLANTVPGQLYFDRVRYRHSESVSLTVHVSGTLPYPPPPVLQAWVADPHNGDAEPVELLYVSPATYRAATLLPLASGTAMRGNGVLEAIPGNLIYAVYAWSADTAGATGDLALVSGGIPSGKFTYSIDPGIFFGPPTLPGQGVGEIDRPVAAVAAPGYPPIRFGEDMVLYDPRDETEKGLFLERRHGAVVQEEQEGGLSVVRLEPATQDLDDLAVLADWLGLEGHLVFSSEDAARLYNLVLEENLDGLRVTLNPLFMLYGEPEGDEDVTLQPFDEWWADDPAIRLDRAWVLASIMDIDQDAVNLAVIDSGFMAGLVDLPGLVDSFDYDEGDVNPFGASASFFGGEWHGAEMWGVAGAIVNNGAEVAGTGGQVAQPMLYRMGLASWVFELDDAMRRAANQGADVINISAGYPCRLGGVNVCNPAARTALCAAVGIGLALLGPLVPLPPTVVLGLSVLAVPLHVFCFTPFNPETILSDAVAHAESLDAVVIAAAGNGLEIDGIGTFGPYNVEDVRIVPCILDNVFCVGAMDSAKVNMEDWGDLVDIWAPTGMPRIDDLTALGLEGTSGSTAYISGVAALMRAVDPAISPAQIRDTLRDTADVTSTDARVHHFVDVYAAFQAAAHLDTDREADLAQVLSFCPNNGWDESTPEGNDSLTLATSVATSPGTIGPVSDAALHPFNDPQDWYRLSLPNDGVLGRYYSMVEDIAYADRVGTPSWSFHDGSGRNLGAFRSVWPGTYYLRVAYDLEEDDTCYSLGGSVAAANLAPPPEDPRDRYDLFRSNDDFGHAADPAEIWHELSSFSWQMEIPDLNFHSSADGDFFRLEPPADAPSLLGPLCELFVGSAYYTLSLDRTSDWLAGSGFTGLYDTYGTEYFPEDMWDHQLTVNVTLGSSLADGLVVGLGPDPAIVDADGYTLTAEYHGTDADSADRICALSWEIEQIIEAEAMIWPLEVPTPQPEGLRFPLDLPCDPRYCDPPALAPNYLVFFWKEDGDMRVELSLPASGHLRAQLLDTAGNEIGEALPWLPRTASATQEPDQRLVLRLNRVAAGVYLLRMTEGDFDMPYTVWVTATKRAFLPVVFRNR